MTQELTVEGRTDSNVILITTTSGDVYRLKDRDGSLDITTHDGAISVHPRAANAIELRGDKANGARQ